MSWDPSLLRKYSSTGHFRLLNQLKGDLGKRPLDRDPTTGAVRMPGSGSRSRRPVGQLPRRSVQTSQMPMAAAAVAMGGNVRVGLEDNIYLDRGVPARNEQLVERVVGIIERMGGHAVTPAEARAKLNLKKM